MEDFFNFVPDNYFLIVIVVVLSGFLRGFIGFGSGSNDPNLILFLTLQSLRWFSILSLKSRQLYT